MHRITALLLVSIGLLAAPAVAQRSQIGFHAGVNFDLDDALLGAQAMFPLSGRWDLYPSFDYYFVDPGDLSALNVDVRYRLPGSSVHPYIGGGLNILFSNGDSDTGVNLLGGIEGRGRVRPYGELRILLHDGSSLQLVGGLSWGL